MKNKRSYTGRRWAKWCPKGCGKKAKYHIKRKKYLCPICKEEFTKKELKK